MWTYICVCLYEYHTCNMYTEIKSYIIFVLVYNEKVDDREIEWHMHTYIHT